ncbi:ABC transporter substrate-binding protein [Amaricoccus solimangrovi]|uniref:Branched-chain amino acid ABC transporter substrate-binding protein n=1 Tax=Amaricoccus solimangrovi TaxID=2589815 RepID=A0A501WGX9_9RHOB|nr:ABC transporter substrate-binding protein [Amaricoccus solimangrovi]TPE48042.1 branched-chain amino acid ABC transporter substrate-binding protein [Amaricoccus solimangrovi]
MIDTKRRRLLYGAMTATALAMAAVLPGRAMAQETVKLAAAGPMTGPSAETGQRMKAGIELAVEEINASGGVGGKTLVVDFYDDEGKPEGAAAVAQRIASDSEVIGVIGHINSSATMAALPIYKRAGLTEVSGNSSAWKVTHMGFDNIFRVIINDQGQAPVVIQQLVEVEGRKKIAIIYENSDYGKGALESATETAHALGAEIVAAETYQPAVDRDFAAQLTKIMAASPDALFLVGQYGEGGAIFNQAYRLGLTTDGSVLKAGFDGLRQGPFIDLAGADAVEGLLIFASFNSLSDAPKTAEFREKTMRLFGHPPTEQEAHNYDVTYLYKAAIEAGATKETMSEVMRTMNMEGVSGHLQFDENGDVKGKEMVIFAVKNGEFVPYVK